MGSGEGTDFGMHLPQGRIDANKNKKSSTKSPLGRAHNIAIPLISRLKSMSSVAVGCNVAAVA